MQLLETMISDLERARAPAHACGALRTLLASAREAPGELFNDSSAFEDLFSQAPCSLLSSPPRCMWSTGGRASFGL